EATRESARARGCEGARTDSVPGVAAAGRDWPPIAPRPAGRASPSTCRPRSLPAAELRGDLPVSDLEQSALPLHRDGLLEPLRPDEVPAPLAFQVPAARPRLGDVDQLHDADDRPARHVLRDRVPLA